MTRDSSFLSLVCFLAMAFAAACDSSTNVGTLPPPLPPDPPEDQEAPRLAAGFNHSCSIDGSDVLRCWGENTMGQLGDATLMLRPAPVRVNGDPGWASVAVGDYHTCGIRRDGTLWCWGDNGFGELGDGSQEHKFVPVRVSSDATWRSVAAAGLHSCAIREDRTLWCWGAKISEPAPGGPELGPPPPLLGLGDNDGRLEPTQVGDASDWTSVSATYLHTCGLRSDGSLWCWGWNGREPGAEEGDPFRGGQLGTGEMVDSAVPARVGGDDST